MYRLLLAALLLAVASPPPARADLQQTSAERRRVYVPNFGSTVEWNKAAIFWFGQVGWNPEPIDAAPMPSSNYVDVRVMATSEALHVLVNVVDYHLWSLPDPQPSDDLSRYDGVALTIDGRNDGGSTPQRDDYRFVSGWRGGGDGSRWRREARGSGAGWDGGWSGEWQDRPGGQWSDGGPNNNGGSIDFGWSTAFTLPWTTLGREGMPLYGERLGFGVELFDRDSAEGALAPVQHWPEHYDASVPRTWGELHIGAHSDAPPWASVEGTTTIRRGLAGSTVTDVTVGGTGDCIGGHEGDPGGFNQGGGTNLFVASQTAITDFPCFARTYLRFGLDQLPEGKAIISAELVMHHWGNSGNLSNGDPDDDPEPTLIQLFSTDGDWSEFGATWNNAPLARENLSAAWVQPRTGPINWPGVAYRWDATAAVRQAYESGQPVNLALYTADSNMHGNKYFVSSDAEDWNAAGRPTLVVTWGQPQDDTNLNRLFMPFVRP